MRDSSRIAYAQARVQARFSIRPSEPFWRELEAGRELTHLIEIVRPGTLGAAVGSISPTIDGHALDARLRDRWAGICAEIAGWYPPSWQPAMRWLAWLPWIAALEWLSRDRPAQDWMTSDPTLADLATAGADTRGDKLRESPFAVLAGAMTAGDNLAEAWHRHWRSLWPTRDARLLAGLGRLDNAIARFLPGLAEHNAASFDASVDQAEASATRCFRRLGGTPVAGMAMLVLLALDHARLRAALVVARWFGTSRTP